ncbi:MAG: hypothetical protein U1F41_13595 [Burkholderiales bacterium]
MKQSPQPHKRQSVEKRIHAGLRRLHEETAASNYALLSCRANYRAPALPIFMLVTEWDGAVTSLRVSRDLNRETNPYRIHFREHGPVGRQKCSNWMNEERITKFINELLMRIDHGDLGPSAWVHFGQNMLANPLDGWYQSEREPLSLLSILTAS